MKSAPTLADECNYSSRQTMSHSIVKNRHKWVQRNHAISFTEVEHAENIVIHKNHNNWKFKAKCIVDRRVLI